MDPRLCNVNVLALEYLCVCICIHFFKKGASGGYCNRSDFTALSRESERENESEMRI